MPTPTHETFCAKVTRNIQRQLDEIANSTDSVAVYARNVEFGLSPTLTFPSDEVVGDGDNNRDGNDMKKYNSHEPDSTFYYENMYWPCVVIEVSFSQKKEDLKGLAEDYILGSDGNTSVVIGLDIEYKISKQTTISVWRPQFEITPDGQRYLVASQTVVDQKFRDDLGNPMPDPHQGLELELKDFVNPARVKDYETMHHRIFISSTTLHRFLLEAEMKGNASQYRNPLPPGTKKRQRAKTPPEITSDDERKFKRKEDKAEARNENEDEDYHPIYD